MSESPDVLIVGAGLSGLACARALLDQGLRPLLLEAGDAVGGRVRTDRVDGYQLDRGFQVLLTAYPTAKSLLDFDGLELQFFEPGAIVRYAGAFHRVADPVRRPRSAWGSLRAPFGTMADKLRTAALARRVQTGSLDEIFERPELTTREYLEAHGFTDRMIDAFFRPFVGGVFLDPSLATSSRMFEFVFRMFAEGGVAVPARGMGAISEQLASGLPKEAIRFDARVAKVEADSVQLDTGERLHAGRVVVATEGPEAGRLSGRPDLPDYRPVTCFYFSAPTAPIREPMLILDGDGRGPVSNLVVMSQVAASYAPSGRELLSATVLSDHADRPDLRSAVAAQMQAWFGPDAEEWEEVACYEIAAALPDQTMRTGGVARRPSLAGNGVYVSGDHRVHGSIEGALISGVEVARDIARAMAGASL